MSNEKPAATPVKNAVHWMLFATALDFPGNQESNITCVKEPKPTGVSYLAAIVPELASVQIRMYRNNELVVTRYVPLAQIKQYEMA